MRYMIGNFWLSSGLWRNGDTTFRDLDIPQLSIQIIKILPTFHPPKSWTEDKHGGPSICRNLMSNWSINPDQKWCNQMLSPDDPILFPRRTLTTRIWHCYRITYSWIFWIWPCKKGSLIWDNLTTSWRTFRLKIHPLVLLVTGNWNLLAGETLCFTKEGIMFLTRRGVVCVNSTRLIDHLPIPPTCWSLKPQQPGLLHTVPWTQSLICHYLTASILFWSW